MAGARHFWRKHMNKLDSLISKLHELQIDGYFLPRNNMFITEDIHPAENQIMHISGFTGSAGTLLIMKEGLSRLFVDGRYELQAPKETDPDKIEVICTAHTALLEWLSQNLSNGFRMGYNPLTISIADLSRMQSKLPQIKFIAIENFITTSQNHVAGRVFEHALEFSGISREEKIAHISEFLTKHQKDAWLFCAADSVSWLLNLRSKCLPDTPILRAYAYVSSTGEVSVFGANLELNEKQYPTLKFYPINALPDFLKKHKKEQIYIDEISTPSAISTICRKHKITLYHHSDICGEYKALKNPIELQGIRKAHERDAVALIKFLHWLDKNFDNQTELDIVEKLHEFRAQGDNYFSESFETIAAYASNGAIVHYQPAPSTNKILKSGSLLLLDSGAQYYDGTTDITRTIALGTPTQEMIDTATYVLKGHINLSRAIFPNKTTGQHLDSLARFPLWQKGLDYKHGTGHGVGCFLNVHEGPLGISTSYSSYPLQSGMITSIEPGYYKEDRFGIRIENLAEISTCGQSNMLCFIPLTLVPFDKKLINPALLNPEEITWINTYHERVYQTISPLLDSKDQSWLKTACKKI